MSITCLFHPLCGWCYGAGGALERVAEAVGIEHVLAPTGLFSDNNARPFAAWLATFAWANDQRIARLTGRPFKDAYRRLINASGATFDSAATLAIVAVGSGNLAGERQALRSLQEACYVDGHHNAHPAVVADVLARAGFVNAARRVSSPDPALLDGYRRRIDAGHALATRFGARGMPALVVEDDRGSMLVEGDALYGDPDALMAQLQAG